MTVQLFSFLLSEVIGKQLQHIDSRAKLVLHLQVGRVRQERPPGLACGPQEAPVQGRQQQPFQSAAAAVGGQPGQGRQSEVEPLEVLARLSSLHHSRQFKIFSEETMGIDALPDVGRIRLYSG